MEKQGEPRYHIELAKVTLPSEPTVSPAPRAAEQLHQLRDRDYVVRGVLELDYFLTGAMIGKKTERKAWVGVALAVDADSGILFPPELAPPAVSAADALVKALTKAVETGGALPREIRVRSSRFKDCLQPFFEACGFPIKVVSSLPTLAAAQKQLLRMLGAPSFTEG